MAQIEETRAIVESDETYDGSVLPAKQADLGRPVRIRAGATVQGSVYGETIEIEEDAQVDGSVMASESIKISEGHVHGETACLGRVVAEDARFGSTVTGNRSRLVDSIVRGNVVGTEVTLENTAVLGLATSDRNLTIEDTLCYTVRSRGKTTFDGTTLVLPQAIVTDTISFKTPVRVAGLGELDTEGGNHVPEMTADDLYRSDEKTYLTLAPRILNLERVTDRLDELEATILEAVTDTDAAKTPETAVEAVLDSLGVDEVRPAVVSD